MGRINKYINLYFSRKMKSLIIVSALIASVSAQCNAGMKITYYKDKDCATLDTTRAERVYSQDHLNGFVDKCVNTEASSFKRTCTHNGLTFVDFATTECHDGDQKHIDTFTWGVCY